MAGQASRMVKTGFTGFPAEGMQFFRSLARNNRREWFQPRKQIYDEQLKAPMMELVTALNAEMMRFAPNYVADEPAKAIYRLYRDTRFSKDKTPYKTHIAAIFPRRGLVKHEGAGLYFSVSAKEIEVAGGVYMPGPDALLAIRTHLAERHEEFTRIIESRKLRAFMGNLQGDDTPRREGRLTLYPLAHIDWIGTTLLPAITSLFSGGFIGWGKPVNTNPSKLRWGLKGLALVALAGPASNIVLAVILAASALMAASFVPAFSEYAARGVRLSLYLAIFNLLPVPPLDGSKLLLAAKVPYIVYAELARFGLLLLLVALTATSLGHWMSLWSYLGTEQIFRTLHG